MDEGLFRWINSLANRTGWAHGFFTFYADFGIVLLAALLVVAYLKARQHGDGPRVAGSIWAGAAPLIALGIGQLIGNSVGRARPYDAMTGVHLLVARTTDFSFPSDHATVAGGVAVGLLLTNRRWGTVAVVLAIVMAFTRVYVGAHYPSDVVAGLVLGGAVAAVGAVVAVPQLSCVVDKLGRTKLRVLVASG